jgi:hypothetical protein
MLLLGLVTQETGFLIKNGIFSITWGNQFAQGKKACVCQCEINPIDNATDLW